MFKVCCNNVCLIWDDVIFPDLLLLMLLSSLLHDEYLMEQRTLQDTLEQTEFFLSRQFSPLLQPLLQTLHCQQCTLCVYTHTYK